MRINKTIINTAAKVLHSDAKQTENQMVSTPLFQAAIEGSVIKEAPLIRRPLTQKEITRIKPSEFEALIEKRTDIPDELRLVKDYQGNVVIRTPEQLSFYDEINNILLQRNVDYESRINFLKNALLHSPEYIVYQRKILPKLIAKGYDLDFLSKIRFDEHNYKFVEKILDRRDELVSPKIKTYVQNKVKSSIEYYKKTYGKSATAEGIAERTAYEQSKAKQYEEELLLDICHHTDENNFRYLKEWSKWADKSPFNGAGSLGCTYDTTVLNYWHRDSFKILEDYFGMSDIRDASVLLEVISRRGHDYNSVKKIFGNSKITDKAHSILINLKILRLIILILYLLQRKKSL